MGNIIVGGGLLLIVVAIVLNGIRRFRQGKSVLCDGSSCSSCGVSAFCQPGRHVGTVPENTEQVVRFVKRVDGLQS